MKIDYATFEEWFKLNHGPWEPKIKKLMEQAFEAGRKLGEDEGARNPYC